MCINITYLNSVDTTYIDILYIGRVYFQTHEFLTLHQNLTGINLNL